MKSLIFLVAFTALLITAACHYSEITQGLVGSKGAKSSSPCMPQHFESCAGDVQFRRESSNLPFSSRTCRGFEIPALCVDRSLPAISRGVLISAREEDGASPAPDTAGPVDKWHVTYETCRGHRSELCVSLGGGEVANQSEAVSSFLVLILPDVASLRKNQKYFSGLFFVSTYHILGYFVSRQIFHIFVFLVDYF